jgi:CRISPR/Cas system-associated exonuclease Cas4 (RecB family)
MESRTATRLQKLSRAEMLTRLQIKRTIEPLTIAAYKKVEEEIWRDGSGNSPHGNPWHVSFHASQFPGDDPMACPRQAMYGLMDLPSAEPFNRRSRTVMAAGKSVEYELVSTFEKAGILISASPDAKVQTGFEYPSAWLTGSVDCVLLPDGYTAPLPIEIKSKYQSAIDEMKVGARKPDEGHIFQTKVQLALIRHEQENGGLWSDLDLVTHGFIYYLSRDRPADTAEFRVDYDEKFFEMGIKKLEEWKQLFIDEELVSDNPSKKHPMGWRWSYQPCQWCNFKKTCKLDFEQGIDKLEDSVGINRAKLVREDYDYTESRKRVLDRWAKG